MTLAEPGQQGSSQGGQWGSVGCSAIAPLPRLLASRDLFLWCHGLLVGWLMTLYRKFGVINLLREVVGELAVAIRLRRRPRARPRLRHEFRQSSDETARRAPHNPRPRAGPSASLPYCLCLGCAHGGVLPVIIDVDPSGVSRSATFPNLSSNDKPMQENRGSSPRIFAQSPDLDKVDSWSSRRS